MILFLSPKNIETYIDESVAKISKLSFLTECNTASTSSNISLNEIPTISNNSSTEVQIISVDNIVLKAYDIFNFDLRSLLNSHIMRRAMLLKYDKERSITNRDRNNLYEIIVCHFLNEGKRLNNVTISILADKIVEIF